MKKFSSTLLVLIVSVLFAKILCEEASSCFESQFKCEHSNRCIALNWRCDGDVDCGEGDQSDEDNCASKTCPPDEFQCDSGQCILQKWKCDGENDCHDGTDESAKVCNDTKCQDDEFRCNNGQCISSSWRCDGTKDCSDGEDETCDTPTCAEDEMRCDNGKCITKKWHCDGESDCGDGDKSDEANCTSSCTSEQFKCEDNKCIDHDWHCDGDFDCDDHSDEFHCKKEPTKNQCIETTEWACLVEEQCILKNWKCDGDEDCFDGTDERNCTYTCDADQFQCRNGHCIDHVSRCDGLPDCIDDSDESDCNATVDQCPEHQFDCYGNGQKCIDYKFVCDGMRHCESWEDENQKLCNDDPCTETNEYGGCDHKCEPLGGTQYKCSCNEGYKLNGTKQCINIDECKESDVPVCSQVCLDVKGHYKCSCVKGYKMESILGKPGKTTCKIDGPRPWLLFANKFDVRKLEVGTWLMEPVVEDLSSAVSIAFYKDLYVYWSDVHLETISRSQLSHNGTMSKKKDIIKTDIQTPDGIAIDWIHDLLYWTDTGFNSIQVASLDGIQKATIISHDLDEPRGITLDPKNGYMYITDWGKKAKIERIGMDGSNRQSIVTVDVVWPNSITIDYIDSRIYWVDAKLHTIKSANLDGTNVRTVIRNAKHISHPFALAVFEDDIFWTDWSSDSIRKAHKYTGEDFQQVALGLHSPMDIKIFHESVQKPGHNVCMGNGKCDYLCLPSPSQNTDDTLQHSCACPDHKVLALDKYSCVAKGAVKTTAKSVVKSTVATTEHPAITQKPIVASTGGPGYTTYTEKVNNTGLEMPKSMTEEKAGTVAFVAIGVVAFLIVVFMGIGCFVYKRVQKRNIKSMNFDNPVYRKTTTTEDSIMISHANKGDHSEIKPLTQDV